MQKRIVFTSIKAIIKRVIRFYFDFDSNACARFFPMEICIQMNNYLYFQLIHNGAISGIHFTGTLTHARTAAEAPLNVSSQ